MDGIACFVGRVGEHSSSNSQESEHDPYEHLQAYYKLLGLILLKSPLSLSSEQLDLLWTISISSASASRPAHTQSSTPHRDCGVLLINWLGGNVVLKVGSQPCLDPQAIRSVFAKLCALPPNRWDLDTFQCFQAFFIKVNEQQGLIEHVKSRESFQVPDPPSLSGMDILWALLPASYPQVPLPFPL